MVITLLYSKVRKWSSCLWVWCAVWSTSRTFLTTTSGKRNKAKNKTASHLIYEMLDNLSVNISHTLSHLPRVALNLLLTFSHLSLSLSATFCLIHPHPGPLTGGPVSVPRRGTLAPLRNLFKNSPEIYPGMRTHTHTHTGVGEM